MNENEIETLIKVDKLETVSKDISKNRMDICNECPQLIWKALGGYCKECGGCLMPLKVRLKYVQCPIDKW